MKIFEPIKIKSVGFQSRIVMAPMVPFGLPEGRGGMVSDKVVQHYLQRMSREMGLMIS